MLPRIMKMLRLSPKCVYFVNILLVVCFLKECASYRTYNHRIDSPFQYKNNKPGGIKNRFHPSTFSAEDSKEVDNKEPDMPVQYAYDGGDSHEGEILVSNVHQQQQDHHHDHSHDHPIETGHLDSDDDYSPPSSIGGYHYAGGGYPYPPPPVRPPLTLPPHKSKQTNDAEYAYYYIGRQLWYVPLYFSIYFVAYVGLLVLKSIARHKVLLPQLSEQAAANAQGARKAADVQRSISESEQKYYMKK